MITPTDALVRGLAVKGSDRKLSGRCFDYHGCWFFPYEASAEEAITGFMIVDKENGDVYPFDPRLNMVELCGSPVVWQFDYDAVLGVLKSLGR